MLQWGFRNAFSTVNRVADVWKIVVQQYRDGDTPLLDMLQEHLPVREQNLLAHRVSDQLEAPNLELVRWLYQHLGAVPTIMPRIAESAALHGYLNVVQFLHERGVHFHCEGWAFRNLEKGRHWELLAFLLEHNHITLDHEEATEMVLSEDEPVRQLVRRFTPMFQSAFEEQVKKQVEDVNADQLRFLVENDAFTIDFPISIDAFAVDAELIRLLHEKGLATATTEAMDVAAECKSWDIVEFLHENRSEGCTTRAMDAAARWGNLKYVKFFHEKRSEGCSTAAMDQAASHGHMDVLRYLHKNTTVGCTTAAIDRAVEIGRLDIVKFLLEKRSEGCTTRAMDHAAKYRRIAFLRYLHENSAVGCTPNAMDGAAKNGHLDVVKFLHKHRREGCTVAAMNEAAAYGHLDVLRYLHQNRQEGCTIKAVKMALRYSRPKVLAFLREKYPEFFGPEILRDVLLHGAFDLFMELREIYPEQADAIVGDVAFHAGATFELPTIRFIVTVLQREDVVSRVIDGAMSRKERYGRSHWFQAVASVTGRPCPPSSGGSSIKKKPTPENDVVPLHPFLLDPRAPSWAISGVLGYSSRWAGPYEYMRYMYSWVKRAVYANNIELLELIRAIPPKARPQHNCNGGKLSALDLKWQFSFENARSEAIRTNRLPILQWLLEKVDLPIEPTLLSEAVFYRRYAIAEWLVATCPEACQESKWLRMGDTPWERICGLEDDLLDWLETHPAVRAALDFRSIIDYAVQRDDATALRKLFEWVPELVLSRPDLAATARRGSAVLEVLKEIGHMSARQPVEKR